MEQAWIGGRLLFQDLYSSLPNPAPDLAGEQRKEHDEEPATNLASEDGHGETCLCHGEPGLFVELFYFDRAQGSEEEFLEGEEEGAGAEEKEVCKDLWDAMLANARPGSIEERRANHEIGAALGEVDCGAVEVGALM